MEAVHRSLLHIKQETGHVRHPNPGLSNNFAASKVNSTTDGPRNTKPCPNHILGNTSKLRNMDTCDSNEASNDQTRLQKLTKPQLLNFIASNEIAKSIVQELVDLRVSNSPQSLTEEDLARLMIASPVLGETFALVAREALENYKTLCKDSYMQALRDIERDNKAWLQTQRHFKGTEGMEAQMGRSPAQVALQRPHDWPVPQIPHSSLEAIAATEGEADVAKVRLRSAMKREVCDRMDQDYIDKRLMRHMNDRY